MEFTPRDPTTPEAIHEWTAGRYVIAELAYLYGQHRIQIWEERHKRVFQILHPEF
jgi:hypothetical protein